MAPRTRRLVAWTLAALALALHLADLMGLKPPPRILPSVVLACTAVLIGIDARRPTDPAAPAWPVRSVVGLLLLLLLLVPIVPIGLIAPGQGVLTVHGLWFAGFGLAWWLRRAAPGIVLALPFATGAAIAGVVWFGVGVLGWQP